MTMHDEEMRCTLLRRECQGVPGARGGVLSYSVYVWETAHHMGELLVLPEPMLNASCRSK
jgi:hypothetical protein